MENKQKELEKLLEEIHTFLDFEEFVYVSDPYSKGDQARNVALAVQYADILAQYGVVSYVPHWSHFWHMLYPHSWKFWMGIDLVVLNRCSAIIRIPGESVGADLEVLYAEILGIPVYYSIEEYIKAKGLVKRGESA